jgi:1-acyl-sn-glycerol-3-phosphate acyltransferase
MVVLLWVILVLIVIVLTALVSGKAFGRLWTPVLGAVEGVLYLIGFGYAKGMHNLQVRAEDGAFDDLGGPMIVVCNHTAGVDPILVSAAVPTKICWLMAEDMRVPGLGWLFNVLGVIFIARNRHGRTGLRRARAHLDMGGVIGIFPEGGIERPAKKLLPFASGVGVLAHRSGARILPVIIEGTPTNTKDAWESLWTRSDTTVRVLKPISYVDSGLSKGEIAKDLHRRYEEWTGWGNTESGLTSHQSETEPAAELGLVDGPMNATRQIAL